MNTSQLLLVSSIGLAINLFGMFATGGHAHHGHSHGVRPSVEPVQPKRAKCAEADLLCRLFRSQGHSHSAPAPKPQLLKPKVSSSPLAPPGSPLPKHAGHSHDSHSHDHKPPAHEEHRGHSHGEVAHQGHAHDVRSASDTLAPRKSLTSRPSFFALSSMTVMITTIATTTITITRVVVTATAPTCGVSSWCVSQQPHPGPWHLFD